MSRLWERGDPLDRAVLRLTVGRDPELDLRLVPQDCRASAAHAQMLASIGVLTADEAASLERELDEIAAEARAGRFAIALEEEDGHTAIENRLTRRLGEAGRKIHTGRSRNDQVIAALRLWGREAVLDQLEGVARVAARLLERAEEQRETTMPGYTHTRQAMPTTLGHLLAGWAEGLLDDVPWLDAAWAHLNRSPLGSASGFGVRLSLDRAAVARELGFAAVQESTGAVQNDRGKSEYLALAAAAATATDLGRLAGDLIWWSSDELGFVRLPADLTTGSSIMPQKRNPDVLELIRAGAARLRSRQAEVGAIYGPLPGGYHRDLQLTKEPFLEGMQSLIDMLRALAPVIERLEADHRRCREAVLPATRATDAVYRRVARGEAFRDAYRAVAADPAGSRGDDEGWRERRHLGAPGALDLAPAHARLEAVLDSVRERRLSVAG
ncbi:MAG: argininosuccinate lyase [Thermoanaerobaculia bacterium]|nr:argininosuccinate lyase [Thermoanaerobaculia bacterium]